MEGMFLSCSRARNDCFSLSQKLDRDTETKEIGSTEILVTSKSSTAARAAFR